VSVTEVGFGAGVVPISGPSGLSTALFDCGYLPSVPVMGKGWRSVTAVAHVASIQSSGLVSEEVPIAAFVDVSNDPSLVLVGTSSIMPGISELIGASLEERSAVVSTS